MNNKDIMYCIALHINSPKNWLNFSITSKSCAKACHLLQRQKKRQFTQFEPYYYNYGDIVTETTGTFKLPNGDLYPTRFVHITNLGEICRYKDLQKCRNILRKIQREVDFFFEIKKNRC